ncbi:hypothetical protein GGX14DRAFT_538026 [Mycena pura]|uniref:Uncharacterized protein n=1 Tax=Mycena pura TaxID=153505 RepID=A0AAD6UUE8_9AGAR|nr:hypothetical protein GGX14DRAFT_538026 [Mycena pura]
MSGSLEPGLQYTSLPPELAAGATFGPRTKTAFEEIRDEEILKPGVILGPFRDDDEWQLAKWLIKHVGHTATEEFLKLPIPSYTNKTNFLEKIDELKIGPSWRCKSFATVGDVPDLEADPSQKTMVSESNEMWFRDPVECVAELMGNPAFSDSMRFAPVKVTEGDEEKRLSPGATIAPLIFSSDKTLLSNFRGDNSAWPVYLTVGNIDKETRRSVNAHATILIGYLPIPKFVCFSKKERSFAKYRLFHQCMSELTRSLIEAGKNGMYMICSDGWRRLVHPILAAYVADYPEQCLVACCKENRCPICTCAPTERGDHLPHAPRTQDETLRFMRRQQAGEKDSEFEEHGIRAVYPPFWAHLPHSDIFQSFTPDLLHQLHKGVFKDHLVSWCTEIIGKLELDKRFRMMPDVHGVRHFKNGISSVSQWTGTEHKEMEKVFLGLICDGADPEMVRAIRGVIDFTYYASLQSHTTTTLHLMEQALDAFHAHKQVFIRLEGRKEHFNIPKIHSLEHHVPFIRLFGTADGFNTESPERLHIDFAKNAYRASNHKDYLRQMTTWLQRQEAVARHAAYLEWRAAAGSLYLCLHTVTAILGSLGIFLYHSGSRGS